MTRNGNTRVHSDAPDCSYHHEIASISGSLNSVVCWSGKDAEGTRIGGVSIGIDNFRALNQLAYTVELRRSILVSESVGETVYCLTQRNEHWRGNIRQLTTVHHSEAVIQRHVVPNIILANR